MTNTAKLALSAPTKPQAVYEELLQRLEHVVDQCSKQQSTLFYCLLATPQEENSLDSELSIHQPKEMAHRLDSVCRQLGRHCEELFNLTQEVKNRLGDCRL